MNNEPDNSTGDGRGASDHSTIRVKVRYAASPTPFEQNAVPRDQLLSDLKATILATFRLTESSGAAYTIFHGRDELADLTRTVGDVAGHAEALELKLSQTVTQG